MPTSSADPNFVAYEISLKPNQSLFTLEVMNIEFFQSIALSVANERSVEVVFRNIVHGLADDPDVVLTRIWLIEPGDICHICPWLKNCPDQTKCLHLVASNGLSIHNKQRYTWLKGHYKRFPLYAVESDSITATGKIGYIGGTGKAVLRNDIIENPNWLLDPAWAEREKIASFAGQPLVFRDETLGVLALFSRKMLDQSHLVMLRTFACNAASAIANARAFEEIEQLHRKLELENEYLRDRVRDVDTFGNIIGQSSALQKILQQIEMVAPTDATVLIHGESGTGKELIALAIHQRSRRKNRPLIKVNCASIPRELFESEFFGHVKGSFTGAIRDRIGRFQLADGGTLFLDEVGDIPLELQSKLLRVLQEGEYERIGEERTRRVNVRVIAATNRDLKKELEAKRFRQDLYFRLSAFPLEIVPLRNRKEDIPLLAKEFLKQICQSMGLKELPLKEKHILQLQNYDWPGNIRELRNVIERAVIVSRGRELRLDLPEISTGKALPIVPNYVKSIEQSGEILTYEDLKNLEKENILAALRQANWKVSGPGGAAELLGMKPTTLASQIKAFGIHKRP
ncbi:MAG: sigma 54-interacting transcriptional regulator [Candidatus Jettenia sp.]|nr:MAG: sigma 54-interacting transcriptional regulator [Candidatus Jettenia sp.]